MSDEVWFVDVGEYDYSYIDGPWATEELATARMAQIDAEARAEAQEMYGPGGHRDDPEFLKSSYERQKPNAVYAAAIRHALDGP